MIRKAARDDIPGVARIYDAITTLEAEGEIHIGWVKGVYPVEEDALEALEAGELFVAEENGEIVAAGRMNHSQMKEYAEGSWSVDAPPEKVLVLHTLCVLPSAGGRGLASDFVRFYERLAAKKGCVSLRMDTGVINSRARALYKRLGFAEAGTVMCDFNDTGRIELVLLEKPLCGGEERS